mmetsp:Transcript_21519/g.48579  ORF Transcript_21519/g.48579 Transcript_21519/m.48579 type:complete len:303 (-) Transcript_21519:162-1070(-)
MPATSWWSSTSCSFVHTTTRAVSSASLSANPSAVSGAGARASATRAVSPASPTPRSVPSLGDRGAVAWRRLVSKETCGLAARAAPTDARRRATALTPPRPRARELSDDRRRLGSGDGSSRCPAGAVELSDVPRKWVAIRLPCSCLTCRNSVPAWSAGSRPFGGVRDSVPASSAGSGPSEGGGPPPLCCGAKAASWPMTIPGSHPSSTEDTGDLIPSCPSSSISSRSASSRSMATCSAASAARRDEASAAHPLNTLLVTRDRWVRVKLVSRCRGGARWVPSLASRSSPDKAAKHKRTTQRCCW